MVLITITHELIKNFANSGTLETGGGKGLPFTYRMELRPERRALCWWRLAPHDPATLPNDEGGDQAVDSYSQDGCGMVQGTSAWQ